MSVYVITDYGVKENSQQLQTSAIQAVLDMCKENGGTVVIPKGRFYTAGLMMYSNTTLLLKEGAELYGSDNCEDYKIFDFPENVEDRSDIELIKSYFASKDWPTPEKRYRRAIISAYGCENISIIGERNSVIDGQDCYDPLGEERYRGPHAVYLTSCKNVLLEGYTAQNSGNFLHEANNCENLTMRRVTCLAGSDGIHAHCSKNVLIENCVFKTGDDCIAGINIDGMVIKNCVCNTSCNYFRLGGVHIHCENCYFYGPGYYPHRVTIVKGNKNYLPRTEGRHNVEAIIIYFASEDYPYESSKDIVFKNCCFDGAGNLLTYHADNIDFIQRGTHLTELIFEDCRFMNIERESFVNASKDEPLTVKLKNITASFAENSDANSLFDKNSPNLTVIEK